MFDLNGKPDQDPLEFASSWSYAATHFAQLGSGYLPSRAEGKQRWNAALFPRLHCAILHCFGSGHMAKSCSSPLITKQHDQFHVGYIHFSTGKVGHS